MKKHSLKLTAVIFSLVMVLMLCSCELSPAQQQENKVNLSLVEQITIDIQEQCSLPEMREVTEDQLAQQYGIDKTDVASFSAFVATDSMTKDEIVIIEALTESEANSIRDSLEDHYNVLLDETKQYLPDEYKKIENTKVVKDGIYIRLFISDSNDKMEDIYASHMSNK
ncbi:MAG: DUF4358 domain-containing protein [Acutalibacteraceae bacterium]|nr:DUF4358 domain-containing protein [Acutalibacteraceae bacterium]